MVIVRQETKHVTGLPREMGSSGDPSPYTALGCFLGMQACVEMGAGDQTSFKDVSASRVQGCGPGRALS